jgi:hypothetical protein
MAASRRGAVLIAAGMWLALVLGCGGGGGVGGGGGQQQPTGTGTVRGEVRYFDFPEQPVTGVEVRLVQVGGTRVVTCYTQDSWYEAYVLPGTYRIVVTPPEDFALPYADAQAPQVTVGSAGQVVTAPRVLLVYATDRPPQPPATD